MANAPYSYLGRGKIRFWWRLPTSGWMDGVSFRDVQQRVYFKKVATTEENVNDEIVEHFRGWRVYCEAEFKTIAGRDEAGNILKLVSCINHSNVGYDLIVKPFFGNDSCSFFINPAILEGDFGVDQIHKGLEVGQTLKLKFASKKILTKLETMTNEPSGIIPRIDYAIIS